MQLITAPAPLQVAKDAEAILASVRASLMFELPRGGVEANAPRFLDVEDVLDPLRPSSFKQDEIAVRWKERLSRLTTFQRRLRQNTRWQQGESRVLGRTDELTRGYFSVSDPRRKVFAKLAAYLSDDEMRVALLTEMDQVTQKETEVLVRRAVKNGGLLDGFPLLVIGAGKIGADVALVLQAFAAGRVLIIDAGQRRGGQFREVTPLVGPDMPAYETNSRDDPRVVVHHRANAGGLQLSNAFFAQAPVQPAALTRSSFLGNHLLGAAAAVNSFLAGPAIQGGRVLGVWQNARKRSEEEALLVRVQVGDSGITIPAFGLAAATGLGEFTLPNPENNPAMAHLIAESRVQLVRFLTGESGRLPKIVTGQGFWQMAVTRGADLFHALINRVVVVAGKQQTALGVLATLLGDAPDKRVYSDVVNKEGGFAALFWVGPRAHTWDQLREELQLPPRYARILVDYPRSFFDTNAAIIPLPGHVVRYGDPGLREDSFEVVTRSGASGDITIPDADLIIACTGQVNDQTSELFFPLTRFAPLRLVQDDETALFREAPGFAGRALVVGPAANLPLSPAEWARAPEGVPQAQLRASIGLNTQKAVIAARELARRYNRQRFSEQLDAIPF